MVAMTYQMPDGKGGAFDAQYRVDQAGVEDAVLGAAQSYYADLNLGNRTEETTEINLRNEVRVYTDQLRQARNKGDFPLFDDIVINALEENMVEAAREIAMAAGDLSDDRVSKNDIMRPEDPQIPAVFKGEETSLGSAFKRIDSMEQTAQKSLQSAASQFQSRGAGAGLPGF